MKKPLMCHVKHKWTTWSAPFMLEGETHRVRICNRCYETDVRKQKEVYAIGGKR